MIKGGLAPGQSWSCTFKYTDGTTYTVELPKDPGNPLSGPAAQCLVDAVCWQDDTCKTVDCAGSGACPY